MKALNARYPGKCAICGAKFPKGANIFYDPRSKQAYCVACGDAENRCSDADEADWQMYEANNASFFNNQRY